MFCKFYSLFLVCFVMACDSSIPLQLPVSGTNVSQGATANKAATVEDILLPPHVSRVPLASNSFGGYLRNIALNDDPTVYLRSRKKKVKQQAQFAVLNITVGNTDLQQCAVAIMRLRSTLLFEKKRFEQIAF